MLCGDACFFFVLGWGFVVVEYGTQGWGVEIVELALFGGDDERANAEGGEQEGGGDHEVDHGHQRGSGVRVGLMRFPARVQIATTVSELIGIRIAAINALINPIIARDAAMEL